ncbi:MAG: tryptophan--tRNA ligase [Candidatus Sericytochromatia bacterium]|nr:tryptophan--tRNA ligase [Candidatus Sericytochromatia bacterium]
MPKERVMSGMRTTGTLHVGHYLGVLVNWTRLQDTYDCFFAAADWHMLTTGLGKTEHLRAHTRAIVLDWLAAGVDPAKATLYVQSAVPETAELHLLLSMVTPVNWLQRDPTLKEMVRELHLVEDTVSYGLLGYPALQTADILGVLGALVPVGEDQVAHLEISRDIARRFNHQFGVALFPDPRPLLAPMPVVFGLDGRKMSKSYGNDLKLGDPAEVVVQKVMSTVTDPARARKTDPGHPEVCAIYTGWETYAPAEAAGVAAACRGGEVGCVQCKRNLAGAINALLEPVRERRAELAREPGRLDDIVAAGNQRARAVTAETVEQVREAMGLNQFDAAGRLRPLPT